MIGIIKDEDAIIIQFNPIFASGLTRWTQVWIPYSPKNYGEYGIAWSWDKTSVIPDVWISWGITTYTSVRAFYKYE